MRRLSWPTDRRTQVTLVTNAMAIVLFGLLAATGRTQALRLVGVSAVALNALYAGTLLAGRTVRASDSRGSVSDEQ